MTGFVLHITGFVPYIIEFNLDKTGLVLSFTGCVIKKRVFP